MKKKMLIGLSLIMVLSCTGCIETINLEKEDENMVVQHMVYSILEHDKNYLVNLEAGVTTTKPEEDKEQDIEEETTTKEENKEEDESENGSNSGSTNQGTNVTTLTMGEALGIKGIDVSCTRYKVCDSYPGNTDALAFVIKAVEGKNLVVLGFDIKNTTNSNILVDVSSTKTIFRGIFSNTTKTNAMVTLLPDALNTYKGTVKAGETIKTVLIFEINEKATLDISSITVDVKAGDKTNSVKIK